MTPAVPESNVQAGKGWVIRSGDFFFKYRNMLFPAVFAVLFLFSKPAVFLRDQRLDRWATVAGIVIAAAGQAFRLAVIGYAYIKRGGKEGKVYADHLVVRGFYAHTRNPMYIGNLFVIVGLSVIYGSPPAYFLVIPFFIYAYLAITAAEECYLLDRFGAQYRDYMRDVNRFLPNFAGIERSLAEFQYDWKRALRKDYGNIFQMLSCVLLILVWKHHSTLDRAQTRLAWTAFVLLAVFYAASRYLKKSGRLASTN